MGGKKKSNNNNGEKQGLKNLGLKLFECELFFEFC